MTRRCTCRACKSRTYPAAFLVIQVCDGGLVATMLRHAPSCSACRRTGSKGTSEMPLPAYGVLIGTLSHFTRDDPNTAGSWYHGKLYVDTPAGQYEGAVDASTPSGIKVQYRLVRHL